jgi:signal transduction histidine kinase
VDIQRTPIARLPRIDLRVADAIAAVALSAAALADAASQPHPRLGPVAIAGLLALSMSVAWRRRNPVLATIAATAGLAAFQLATSYAGDGTFEVAPLALDFYLIGRRAGGRPRLPPCAAAFACTLAAFAVTSYSAPGGSVGAAVGAWTIFAVVPFAFGRTLATGSALTAELAVTAARLQDEQELRARRAAGDERNRMARELHDVIAHGVSVMVIQSSAARLVAAGNVDAAREALGVVERSGREALVELRRIVGVLRHSDDELAGAAAPGLSQLEALAERARAAGLPVDLRVDGRPATLGPGLDLVVYRVVQEALTNAIKHAGPARAHVRVSVGAREVRLEIVDDGAGRAPDGDDRAPSGHGLRGMAERVMLYGGQLSAQRRPGAGFEVRARIPIDGAPTPSVDPAPVLVPSGRPASDAPADAPRWPWLDPVIAGVALVVLETEVLSSHKVRGPLLANVLIVAVMALAAVWRRRSPLAYLFVAGLLSAVLSSTLDSLTGSTAVGLYTVLFPPYAVAAWAGRRRAAIGLAFYIGGSAFDGLLVHHVTAAYFLGGALSVSAAWAAGRATRSRRRRTAELRRRSAQLAAEREDRALLAIAGERSRIARELHAVVARSVAAMVVQAEAARGLLDVDPAAADSAIVTIEITGRQALVEMRRILGVLRHSGEAGELEPQPGVDAIYGLIQRARDAGQAVELSVDGEPGVVPAGVDLGIYRILEDALSSAREQPGDVAVSLRFGDADLVLRVRAACQGPSCWPTLVMRERVALCGGDLETEPAVGDGWQLVARMPRGLAGALA